MDKENQSFDPRESGLDPEDLEQSPDTMPEFTPSDEVILEKIMAETREEAADTDLGDTRILDLADALTEDPAEAPEEAPGEDPDTPEEEIQEDDTMPVKKKKPEKKKGVRWFGIPQLLVSVIWLVLIVLVGVTVGRTAWVLCSDLMAFGKPDQEATIQITEEDNIASIAKKLSDAELIRYPDLFKTFANLTKKSQRISVGTYTLNSKYDYNAMINAMIAHTTRQEVEVTIPEGYNCAQIFALLEEKGVCSAADLEKYAESGEIGDYWFLEGVTRDGRYCLEGYLFPDTYRFYTNDKPANVIGKMLNNFDNRFTDLMKERLATINDTFAGMMKASGQSEEYIRSHQITIREVVIIASLIEKETASAEESHTISSVIYNRLADPGAYPYLNIDAALVYALGGKVEKLTEQDKQLDSPYNTYQQKGLIPGPIANPGRESINAALDPDTTDYYYYAYNPASNRHHFSQTLEQHQQFLALLK